MFFSMGYFSHYRGCSDENDILLNFQNFKFPETQIADDFTLLDSFLLINFYWELYLLPILFCNNLHTLEVFTIGIT